MGAPIIIFKASQASHFGPEAPGSQAALRPGVVKRMQELHAIKRRIVLLLLLARAGVEDRIVRKQRQVSFRRLSSRSSVLIP